MKLKDRLKDGEVVKIGFVNGSGFIFCGKMCERAREFIERKSQDEHKNLIQKQKIIRAQKCIYPNNTELFADFVEVCKRLESWIPFMDRKVIEEFHSVLNPNNRIIMLEGDEKGKFWKIDEFREKHEWAEGEDE